MRLHSRFLQEAPEVLSDAEALRIINRQPRPGRVRLAVGAAALAVSAALMPWLQRSAESTPATSPLPHCNFDQDSPRLQTPEYRKWHETQSTQQMLAAHGPASFGVAACDQQVQHEVIINNRVCQAEKPITSTPPTTEGIHPQPEFSAFAACGNS